MPTQEMPMHYINREEWGATPSLQPLIPLEHPIKYVRLTFAKDIKKCSSNHKCVKRMRQLQTHDMTESKLPDMQPNFVVAGDGYVYEGRGWRAQPEQIPDRPDLNGKFVEFSYLGDWSEIAPNNEMLRRSWVAMQIGMDNKFLDKDFEILYLGGPTYKEIGWDEPSYHRTKKAEPPEYIKNYREKKAREKKEKLAKAEAEKAEKAEKGETMEEKVVEKKKKKKSKEDRVDERQYRKMKEEYEKLP